MSFLILIKRQVGLFCYTFIQPSFFGCATGRQVYTRLPQDRPRQVSLSWDRPEDRLFTILAVPVKVKVYCIINTVYRCARRLPATCCARSVIRLDTSGRMYPVKWLCAKECGCPGGITRNYKSTNLQVYNCILVITIPALLTCEKLQVCN